MPELITVKLEQLIEVAITHFNNAKRLGQENLALLGVQNTLQQEKVALQQTQADLAISLANALANDSADAATIAEAQLAAQTAQLAAQTAQENLASLQTELDAKSNEVRQLEQQLNNAISLLTNNGEPSLNGTV